MPACDPNEHRANKNADATVTHNAAGSVPLKVGFIVMAIGPQ
jgi:hypothetical protein